MQKQNTVHILVHRVKRSYVTATFVCGCLEALICLCAIGGLLLLNGAGVPDWIMTLYYWVQTFLLVCMGLRLVFLMLPDSGQRSDYSGYALILSFFALIFVLVPLISAILLTLAYVMLVYDDVKYLYPRTKPVIVSVTVCEICEEPSLYDLCQRCRTNYAREHRRVVAQLNRARQAKEPATLKLSEWVKICATYEWKCYDPTCDKPFTDLGHILPIGHGDAYTGGTTKDNCRPLCRAHNVKMGNRHPADLEK